MNIIDAHTMFGFWPRRRADMSAETLVRLVRQHEISAALTISTTGVFADFVRGNDETVALCQRAGKLLLPVGTVDPRRYVGSLEEIDKRVEQGVRVWRLFPELQDWPLESRPVNAILTRLAERNCTLLIHAAEAGAPSKVALVTAPMKLTTVLLGVTGRQLGELVALLDEAPQIWLETRRLADPQVVRALGQRFGVERLVFGTASPLQYISSALLPLQNSGLAEDQLAGVLGGNIARRLGGR
ncbi:MAG: amidohydrolase family protein [Armatimonadetes bacterium]|nr:amidohydrolase family protein [Armatimonadota bacterium]